MRSQRRILQEENEQSTDGCVTAVRENFSSDTMSEPESELDSTHIVQDTYFDESKSHSDPTSPLVLFRTYDSNIQLELVSDYLYNHRGEHIKIKSRNHKTLHWINVPGVWSKSKDEETEWTNFQHRMPKELLSYLCVVIGGTIAAGVYLLCRLLYSIDQEAALLGFRKAGAVAFGKLSAVETVALKSDLGISQNTTTELGSKLIYYNGGNPVLANADECRKVKNLKLKQSKAIEKNMEKLAKVKLKITIYTLCYLLQVHLLG